MNEADWLKCKDPEAMLALVGPHLSRRQWTLLAAMFVRRLDKLLADPRLTQVVTFMQRHAGIVLEESDKRPEWEHLVRDLPSAISAAIERVREEQRAIVQAADPDSDPETFQHVEGRKTNPSAPLFQAAAERARQALEQFERATVSAGAGLQQLLLTAGNQAGLAEVRRAVLDALQDQAVASLNVTVALKLKALGDESADRDNARDVGKRYAAALESVSREDTYSESRENTVLGQRERSERKALGAFLHELCGNVCQPAVLQPEWRTTDVVALAQSIAADGSFDQMPILNDALLDAGCNSRQILRHCRGLKEAVDEPVQHAPGCWVIDLILQREPTFREQLPLGTATPPRRRAKRA